MTITTNHIILTIIAFISFYILIELYIILYGGF